jgi:DnaK suppressor protein
MDTDRARSLLEDELRRLDELVEFSEETRDEDVGDGDRLAVGMDVGDRGSRIAETMEDDLQEDTSRAQRDRVRAAIERLDDGTYGRCEVCGREIDDERLEARPETNRCREHAA